MVVMVWDEGREHGRLQTFDSWRSWDDVRSALVGHVVPDVLRTLEDAFDFAVTWHGEQLRPTGEPYRLHLLEVLEVLVRGPAIVDPGVLTAAVLHDVLEDTACPPAEVQLRFGDAVFELVEWTTKPDVEPAAADAARIRYLEAFRAAPEPARLVKLADRTSNVQHLDRHPRPAKQRSYYRETVEKVVPLAEATPWFGPWFRAWQHHFGYLAADAGDGDAADPARG